MFVQRRLVARIGMLAFVALLAASAARAQAEPRALPNADGEAAELVAIAAPFGDFEVATANEREIRLALSDPGGHVIGAVIVLRGTASDEPRLRSRHYGYEVATFAIQDGLVERLVGAAHAIADQDGGASENPHPHGPVWNDDLLATTAALCAGLAIVLGLVRRGAVHWAIRLPHLIPAVIQLSLLTYWSAYWPDVRAHASSLGWQLAIAVSLDAAFSFARFGSWRVGASPLPVVFSSNLFVWFDPHGIIICLLVAFATKALVHRDGRHVLNPSAVGLAAGGVVSYAAPGFVHAGGLFHTMSLAPNMAELMVLLAMVPQLRFRILPVSIGAVAALRLMENPTVSRPPMILAFALLATDPSTLPATDAGKALFGLFIGFGMVGTSWTLRRVGLTDDFAKVMPIPVANALGPQLDRLGAGILARVREGANRVAAVWPSLRWMPARPPRPIPNVAFLAAWLLVTVLPLTVEKPLSFEEALHWNLGTRFVVRDADDVPRCPQNPLFCRPFTFAREIRLWTAGASRASPH